MMSAISQLFAPCLEPAVIRGGLRFVAGSYLLGEGGGEVLNPTVTPILQRVVEKKQIFQRAYRCNDKFRGAELVDRNGVKGCSSFSKHLAPWSGNRKDISMVNPLFKVLLQLSHCCVHRPVTVLYKDMNGPGAPKQCRLIRFDHQLHSGPTLLTHDEYCYRKCSDRTHSLYPRRPVSSIELIVNTKGDKQRRDYSRQYEQEITPYNKFSNSFHKGIIA